MDSMQRRVLAALDHYTNGRGGVIPAQIYVAGDDRGIADFSRWYVTGPKDRSGYISGPIPAYVVRELASAGKITADVRDQYGKPLAFVLPKYARTYFSLLGEKQNG